MENLNKIIDCKFTVALRNKLVCKKCDMLPRPNTEIMRCASCKNILCGKCCGTKCPLCQHESKDPNVSTFAKETELMEILSGLKTHPCINVKNGCLEEIPAKLDALTAHEQSCVFQKIPCPHCKDFVIFKDLGQHLKDDAINDIEVYYGTETNEYTYWLDMFGVYKMQAKLVNGRIHYKNEKSAIWWCENKKSWLIGRHSQIGEWSGFAYITEDVKYPHEITGWNWRWDKGRRFLGWQWAFKGLGIRKVFLDLTSKLKEWNFVGTKKELCDKFFCVNAYDRQFYPQFKEVNNCLMVRTLILGLQEEAIPFEVSITFYLENGKNFEFKDNVYPITEDIDSIFETSMQCHLKKLTKYYDAKSREIKNQPKIDFCLKIISPKLDEIAKDQHFESGIEDTDEEMNEKDSASGSNKKK